MDNRDSLAFYPFLVVRIARRVCSRNGAYRLARLAAKFGPESASATSSNDFPTTACGARRPGPNRQVCGVYPPDLEQPRPPDLPPGLVRLRVVVSND
jgi:hypothetical protein